MPISVACPACGKKLKAPDALAGKTAPCPGCRAKVQVPASEDAVADFLLGSEEPGESTAPAEETSEEPPPKPRPLPQRLGEGDRHAPRRPVSAPWQPPEKPVTALPPLTMNEPPLWLRHLHWLLVLALIPLAFSLLGEDEGPEAFDKRLEETLEHSPPEIQQRFVSLAAQARDGKEVSLDDVISILPEQRLSGAFLPRKSWTHWGMAVGAAVLFMAFFVFLATGKVAEPTHLLVIGLFTATAGILLLLALQTVADWTRGFRLRGGNILVLLFYVVKFIGYSYQAALDPENGFFLSFLGYTLGVGLCEEVCKALPLFWKYREKQEESWRTAFLWGLASGAGFGIAEGILYASRHYNGISGPGIYLVRFLSCVALHALWTGSVAITLNQKQELLQQEINWYDYIPRIVFIVGIPMILHGLYDTFLKKDMKGYALAVAVASFLFLAFQISRLHGSDAADAKETMLKEYKRRRAALS
jgi:RsiW-degrading membrane proteinase PrsW (M82 family)